jgi:hypothetical protein
VLDAPGRGRCAERARATWTALRRLHDRRTQLYREPASGLLAALGLRRPPPEHLWPFAGCWAAALAMSTLPPGGGEREDWRAVLDGHLTGMAAYAGRGSDPLAPAASAPLRLEANAFPAPGSPGDAYHDDNAWIALDLYAQHGVTGDEACLGLARRTVDFVLSGWSTQADWSHPGGIRWAEPAWSRTRNTCSNAPAAQAAALGHLRAGEPGRLEWALRILDWVDGALRADNGLYRDLIEPNGSLQDDLWAYNQGTMIGARVLCYEATGEPAHLDRARATASACLGWLGSAATLQGQPPPFLAIYLRNLLLLGAHSDVGAGVEQVAGFADWAWEHERDARNGLFRAGELRLNRTAGMASIYALLAGARQVP